MGKKKIPLQTEELQELSDNEMEDVPTTNMRSRLIE